MATLYGWIIVALSLWGQGQTDIVTNHDIEIIIDGYYRISFLDQACEYSPPMHSFYQGRSVRLTIETLSLSHKLGSACGYCRAPILLRMREIRPYLFGDLDHDGDVDLQDFAWFQQYFSGEPWKLGLRDYHLLVTCLSGPEKWYPEIRYDLIEVCPAVDYDKDGDVDLRDFTIFQNRFGGSER